MKRLVRSQTGIVHLMDGDATICFKMFRHPHSIWSFKELDLIKSREFCKHCFKHGRKDAMIELNIILKD